MICSCNMVFVVRDTHREAEVSTAWTAVMFSPCVNGASHTTRLETRGLDGRIVSPFTITLVQPTSWNTQRMGETTQERRVWSVIRCMLSFGSHISNISRSAFFHLCNIARLRSSLSQDSTEVLIHRLQLIQKSADRIVTNSRIFDHISPILFQLHWLLVHYRVHFKIVLLTYKALHNLAPSLSLRSSSFVYSFALLEIIFCRLISHFKVQIKTYLFRIAFNDLLV